MGGGGGGISGSSSNFVFYAQSTITVISGRYTFLSVHNNFVKHMYKLKLVYIFRFL